MQFTRELPGNTNVVRSYATGEIRIGEKSLRTSCLFNADNLIEDWPPSNIAMLTPAHFAAAFDWQPEIILLGTGQRQLFPSRDIFRAIQSLGIGFEVMDTGAACRTFNVLVGESRRVVAGILLDR